MLRLKRLILRYYERYLKYKYRFEDPDVCCCGSLISKGGYYQGCDAPCGSMMYYVIDCAVDKLDKRLGASDESMFQ